MNPNIRIITKDDYDELEKLYSDGKTYKELAKHYNCSTKTISDYLNVKTDIGKKVRIKSNRGWGRKTIYTLIKKDKLLGIGTKRDDWHQVLLCVGCHKKIHNTLFTWHITPDTKELNYIGKENYLNFKEYDEN